MGFGNSDVPGPLTLFGGWMPGHSWKKKNNSLFIKKWQAVECGLHKGEAGPLGQEACKCVLCCYNVESPSVVRSLPVLTSEIVCCTFIHVIPSLFIIFMPLPLMYLRLLFMEVTPFTCGTSTSLGKGPRWSPRNTWRKCHGTAHPRRTGAVSWCAYPPPPTGGKEKRKNSQKLWRKCHDHEQRNLRWKWLCPRHDQGRQAVQGIVSGVSGTLRRADSKRKDGSRQEETSTLRFGSSLSPSRPCLWG